MVTMYVSAYVCARCGYVEMHVDDQDRGKLGAVARDAKHWEKIG